MAKTLILPGVDPSLKAIHKRPRHYYDPAMDGIVGEKVCRICKQPAAVIVSGGAALCRVHESATRPIR